MRELTIEDIDIKGLIVSLYMYRKKPEALKQRSKNVERVLKRRRLVSPDFIEILFKIQSTDPIEKNDLTELWSNLSSSDKDFLSYIVNQVRDIRNSDNGRKFQLQSSKSYQALYQKIKLIEDGIKAGATNPSMYDEFKELVNRLEQSGQINKIVSVRLIRSLESLRS